MFKYASSRGYASHKCNATRSVAYNITVTHHQTGAVSTFYGVPFFKALHVMSYLRSVNNSVSYEVSEANESEAKEVSQS